MERLTDFKTYLKYVDQIAKTHVAISRKSTIKFTYDKIYSDLIASWKPENWVFLATFDDDSLKFFVLVEIYETEYWLRYLYSDVKFRHRTKECVNEIKQKLKEKADLPCYAETHILTPSYKRFAKSLDFFPHKTTYKCNL